MTRKEKLKKLEDDKATKGMVIISNGEPFIEVLSEKIVKLKEVLGEGIELKNLDDLLEQLGVLQSFQVEVKDLKEAIKTIDFPANVKVSGLEDLAKAIEVLSKRKEPEFKIDEKLFTDITKSIVELTLKVEEAAVPPKQDQKPSDYIPMRRVMKVGNKLMYDDSFYTGGGGGSTVASSSSGGGATTIADGADISQGAKADATYSSGDGSVISVLKGIFTRLAGLVTSNAGGYVRQDSTGTIAKETGGNLETIASVVKTEDAGHSSGDKGIFTLAVRNDTGAPLAGSDLDYIPLTVDSTGALRTDLNGTVSTNNSTTATLTSGSVFTGTSDDCLNYNEIRISVKTDVASATDGLSIQQSSDNTNWDIIDTYTVSANSGKTIAVPRQARYVRIVYTNGGTNQASFRLQTILNRLGAQASSQRPSDGYTNETDLGQVQAFGMVYNANTWDRMKSVATGVQAVGVNDGTNTASVVANDSGYNGQVMNHSTKTLGPVSTTGTGAQILFANTDVRGYASMRVVWSAVGSGLVSTAQFANTSGGTYANSTQFSQGASSTVIPTTTGSTAAVRYIGPIIDNFFQLNVTALTSGTATVVVTLSTAPFVPPSTTVQGVKTNNNVVPAGTNLGVLPAVANAAQPTFTETFQTTTSVNLKGSTRSVIQDAALNDRGVNVDAANNLQVVHYATTPTLTNVASSATSVSLLASNGAAKSRIIYNDSTQILYLKFGTTASATSYTAQVGANTLFEFPLPTYTGAVDGIWASANGNARITEVI